jgi:hypothetical protein
MQDKSRLALVDVTIVPDALSTLTSLKSLSKNGRLTSLPEAICTLTGLTALDLGGCIDTAWLNAFTDVNARPVGEQFLRYDSFVVSGIAAKRDSGSGQLLLCLQPEAWHTTKKPAWRFRPAHYLGTCRPGAESQALQPERARHKMANSGTRSAPWLQLTSSTCANVGCDNASCRALVVGRRTARTQFHELDGDKSQPDVRTASGPRCRTSPV